jgi:predicted metal-dependent hydrolase
MNAIGVQHGVPIDKVEGVFKLIRKQLQHRLSDDMQSSIAAAFEHFTAIISSVLLEHPELFDKTHPELRAMLYWHFVEETEHKSVSYDVFVDASGGGFRSYRLRASGMLLAIALGFPIMIGNQTYLLYKDRQILNLRSAAKMAKILFWRPGILSKVLGGVPPYFSPTFHPWDDDNRDVIRIWKRAYEETGDAQKAYQALRNHRSTNIPETLSAAQPELA